MTYTGSLNGYQPTEHRSVLLWVTLQLVYVYTHLKSCSGLYGTMATGLSDGRLCTSISPLNVRLIRHGQPVELYNAVLPYVNIMHVCMHYPVLCIYVRRLHSTYQ